MKTIIILPDSKKEVELERADMLFWIRRGKCPKWFAALYISRGQGKTTDDQLKESVTSASVDEMQELLAFDDILVSHAVRGQSVDLDAISSADYEAILSYVKYGKLSQQTESEESGESLETFHSVG